MRHRNGASSCFPTVIFLSHLAWLFYVKKEASRIKDSFTKADQPYLKIKDTVFSSEDESLKSHSNHGQVSLAVDRRSYSLPP